ncbi:glycerophosphodiester phosphodiesterase family protein [Ornithinimicrobium sp. LYQ92]|uniref:glycerophosphodiester phosphodiesterase family protein n=1 Tax=Serinicoccus sp. LYQ92 TaxID=3378798 RepID=UPI003854C1EB
MPDPRPLVIAHRGASGYLPEHTLAAYELAARQGADYLEPDVVATRDGVLVARHENEISGTTDIADRPRFADRRTTKVVDGREVTGWFTEDLTLEELRTLRARERLPHLRGTDRDGEHPVATLAEIVDLRGRLSAELGREIGLYIETKHPTYFAGLGLALEEPLLAELDRAGLEGPGAPVFLQCFELTNLRRMRHRLGSGLRQVFLASAPDRVPYDLVVAGTPTSYRELLGDEGMARLAGDVDGIGPAREMVVPRTPEGALGRPTRLVERAHRAGLVVHPWTLRAENHFLPPALHGPGGESAHGDLAAEATAYLEAGVDGFFTDHPDLGVSARDRWAAAGS